MKDFGTDTSLIRCITEFLMQFTEMIPSLLAALLVFFAVHVMFQGEPGVLRLGHLGSLAGFIVVLLMLLYALRTNAPPLF